MQTMEDIALKLEGKVKAAMTEDVQSVSASTHVGDVADRMLDENLRRMIVVDGNDHVIGVVSQRDILRQYIAAQENNPSGSDCPFESVEIGTLLGRDRPVTASPDLPLAKAAAVLATNKIGCLPVVGYQGELMGMLTTSDVLRHITGGVSVRLESAFQMYSPTHEQKVKLPAYIRKASGELVIPLKRMDKPEACTKFAVLGYDGASGRILIKFVPDEAAGGGADAVMKARTDDGCLVVTASGFVTHYNLAGKTSAFDISSHKDNRYLVLTPRQAN
jgi:CBS domain-containing protein